MEGQSYSLLPNKELLEKIETLEKMVDSFFIKVVCKEDYYISPAICMPSPNSPEPTLIFEKGKIYQYKLDLYDHPNPEYKDVWHTVYHIPEAGEDFHPWGTNFSRKGFEKHFECIER